MTYCVVALVESICIVAVKQVHSFRQIRIRSFDKEMIVIVHQAVGMAKPAKTLNRIAERIKKPEAIGVIPKYMISCIATGGHVVYRAGKLYA